MTKRVRNKKKPNKEKILKEAVQNPLASIHALTKQSLYNFIVYFWDTYSTDKFVSNFHIPFLCSELETIAKRVGNNENKLYDLIINIPPGTTKTAIVSIFFPVWCWVNWYWMRFLTTSHSDALSLESAEYSRDIIRSDKFKLIFPEIDIKQDKDQKSNFRVVYKTIIKEGRAPSYKSGGGRVSTSVGAKIVGFHAHIILPDDLMDPKSSISAAGVKAANDYLDQTLSTRKTDKRITVMALIMQRLSENDCTQHLLDKGKDNIKQICLPGDGITYRDQIKPPELFDYYVDGLLDPVRMPRYVLEELEADLGQYAYAGQVGQKPTPPGGGMFKVDQISIVDQMPLDINIMKTVRYWDKAGTAEWLKGKAGLKKNDGARTAGVKICSLKNGKYIVMNVVTGRWEAQYREAKILNTAHADGETVDVWIEQEPGSGGKESAQATIRMLAGYHCEAEHPVGDKAFRADPFSVQVNNGNVMMLRGDWNTDFIHELEGFPFGKLKDQVDAVGAGFSKLRAKKKVKSYS